MGDQSADQDVRQTLFALTRTLAAGTGTLKERLRPAFTPAVMALRPEHFPWPDLGLRWGEVMEELAPDNRTHVILAQWWDFELAHIAEEIVDIYDQIARRMGSQAA